ncbi:MAG: phage tail tape measure protein, partial [Pseudomonadota bacterium]|nr:phage tail tape measure protein [Pseudomonadota bacterium]
IGNALGNSFKTAEDAFVQFATTGKLEFKSMAASILSDLARIAAKKAIAGLVDMAIGAWKGPSSASVGDGGWLARGDLAGARAAGGPVGGGLSYLVGEKGPEIFTPAAGGTIIPNHELGGGSGAVTINLSTTVSSGTSNTEASGDSNSQSRLVADALNAKLKQMIARETQQGGIIYNFQNGRG